MPIEIDELSKTQHMWHDNCQYLHLNVAKTCDVLNCHELFTSYSRLAPVLNSLNNKVLDSNSCSAALIQRCQKC
jgi:hypothetical protein